MVEHATENRSVGGSIPPLGTIAPSSVASDDRLILFHDGACPLCRGEIAAYRRQDENGALGFIDVADPASEMAPGLARDAAKARFHVQLPDGRLVSGAAGFVEVWRRLPRWRRLARLVDLPGVLPLFELAYRASLVVRPRLAAIVARRRRS